MAGVASCVLHGLIFLFEHTAPPRAFAQPLSWIISLLGSVMQADHEISLNDTAGGEEGLGLVPVLVIGLLCKRRSFSPHTCSS